MMLNKRLLSLCKNSKKYILLSIAMKWLALLSNITIVYLASYLLASLIIDIEIQIEVIILHLAVAIMLRFASHIIESISSQKSSFNARNILRKSLYDKLLRLGISYTQHVKTADIIQLSGEGIETLDNYFGKYLPQFFYAMLAPITLFAVFSFISFKTALVLIICVPLIPLSIIMFIKIAKKIMGKYWNNYTDLAGSFLESLQGLTELKLFSADDKWQKKLSDEAEGFRKTTMKVLSMQLNSITIMDIIAYGGAAAGSIIALIQLQSGQLSVQGFITIVLLSAEFFLPLRMLGSFFHIATTGVAAAEKIFSVLDTKENSKGNLTLTGEIKKINLKNLTFGYLKETNVLENIDMTINKNEFIAIVGKSGCGKSTIAALLTKMHKAPENQIFFNDIDCNKIDSDSLLKHIYLLSSDSYIFSGTIRENLQLAKPKASKAQIIDAMKKAQFYDFVDNLPDGIDTNIGESGSLLSGGQKQRLALTRAILTDRQILILDEVTSNVDVESEEKIISAIDSLRGQKTIVTITHRLESIKKADRIYLLDNGKIAECGTNDELCKLQGKYANMLNAQQKLLEFRKNAI